MPPEAEGITEAIGLFAQIAETAGVAPWAVNLAFALSMPIFCWYVVRAVMMKKFPPNGNAKKALEIAEANKGKIDGLKKQATTEHNQLREDIKKMGAQFTDEVKIVGERVDALRDEIHNEKVSDLKNEIAALKATAANSPPAPSQK